MSSTLEPMQWLDGLFVRAFEMSTSDIFLDVHEGNTGVTKVEAQLRIDNELIDMEPIEGPRAYEVSNVIRQTAGIGTGALIEPGEGRYPYIRRFLAPDNRQATERLDIRVTMYPDEIGQFISMRIPPIGALRPLEELGFSQYNYNRLMRLLAKPGGLTLLAGPMGSGKTTTLYSAVMKMGGRRKSVITVEDPKERTLPGARQIEINNGTEDGSGMTYANVLKSLLRVVMDVLLIGEVRDHETAEAAIRIATAGARVFSSIHADDPVSAIARTISYAEASAINVMSGISGVASQRMIRKLCTTCYGDGCANCSGIGFRGKTPVHEVLINTPAITEAFILKTRLSEISGLARYEGMKSFHEDADRLLQAGVTTEKEIESTIGFDMRNRTAGNFAPPAPKPQKSQAQLVQQQSQTPQAQVLPQQIRPRQNSASVAQPQNPERPP